MTTLTQIRVLASLLLLVGPTNIHAQVNPSTESVFANPLDGVSLATVSDPILNVGQGMHVLKVSFPAETTAQSPIAVRLEWSRDGVAWRPAGPDVTSVPVLSSGIGATDVVAYIVYYGTFRAIRVGSTVPTPGGALMDVDYIGTIFPLLPFLTLEGDRWVF